MSRIVIIDDAPEIIETISSALHQAGHEVVPIEGNREAEHKIRDQRPDLVLLDIVMPERNGFEILRGIRKTSETKACPVVIVSRKSEASDQQWAKMQGATDFLAKPFTSEQLLQVVGRNLPPSH